MNARSKSFHPFKCVFSRISKMSRFLCKMCFGKLCLRSQFVTFEGINICLGANVLNEPVNSKRDVAHSFEQSFSADGGKTWEVNFIGTLERISQ